VILRTGESRAISVGRAHRCAAAAILLLSLLFSTNVFAQATQPASAAGGAYEDQPIVRTHAAKNYATTRDSAGAANANPARLRGGGGDLMGLARVLAALGVVLGLIFGLRWFARRFFPGAAGTRASGVVRVLSRSPVAPKQHVLLVQVGRRVLVVADNGAQLCALSQITDPDEVAQLIGEVSSAKVAGEAFDQKFGKAKQEFDANLGPSSDDALETSASASDSDEAQDLRGEDPTIGSAKGEIDGLMEKVRVLAKQLGRSSPS
jgi:flagellar biogenesis protein FliO